MLIGVVKANSLEKIKALLLTLPSNQYDALELRLDYCQSFDIAPLYDLRQTIKLPVIVTLRSQRQGGFYAGTEAERLSTLMQLTALKPQFIDIEADSDPVWIKTFQTKYPHIQLILSHHDFAGTPDHLEAILEKMRNVAATSFYKIATMAHSTLDALRLLKLSQTAVHPEKIIAIAMGELGESTRILTPVMGSGWSYCVIDAPSAPGQLTMDELINTYHFKTLNRTTKIYGLIGDPVAQSIGHVFHNEMFKKCQQNAVYVKWKIKPHELQAALTLFSDLGVAGLSVTRPLKECIGPYVINEAIEAQAVNTLQWQEGKWRGFNTDGQGALAALGIDLNHKTVLILGAGGAARAIAVAATQKGAAVIVLNRTWQKAFLKDVQLHALDTLANAADFHYDVMINTLPVDVTLPLSERSFISGSIVMDINYYHVSDFAKMAQRAGCHLIDGLAMYQQQALMQREVWGQSS